MMSSPPKPPFGSNQKHFNTYKTPFQSNHSLHHRSFKSQTSKYTSKFIADNSRLYPQTAQRQAHQPSAINSKPSLASRLGSFLNKQPVVAPRTTPGPKVLVPPTSAAPISNPPTSAAPALNHRTPAAPALNHRTPAASALNHRTSAALALNPRTPAASALNPRTPAASALNPRTPAASALNPRTPVAPVLDLRTPAAQVLVPPTPAAPVLVLPAATATKPPLSVAQYTQPTPVPSNRQNTHQISQKAHSEPSIKYQIKVNDKVYKVLRKIGSGGSAKVYEGFEPLTSQTVAIKIINVASVDQKTRDSYFNEERLLAKLRGNQHVVCMYDSEYKEELKELLIVMEKGDTDLSQVIDSYFKTNKSMIDGIFIKFYWRGMVQAVNDIHKHGIVHADLKPVNFILVKNQIKLIDFGIASAVAPGCTSVVKDYQIGTINYMAPESLKNRALDASFQYLRTCDVDENNQQQQKRTVIKYNTKVDIWSLGCILYNLVYGRPPFDNLKDILSKVQAITDPQHSINFPEISNQKLLNCMKSCLRYDPSGRPSAQDLLEDPYLKEDFVVLQK